MKAQLTHSETSTSYSFVLELDGIKYSAQVWLNEKGKFIDHSICFESGEELEHEGDQGEIQEKVLDYLDENWDTLTNENKTLNPRS